MSIKLNSNVVMQNHINKVNKILIVLCWTITLFLVVFFAIGSHACSLSQIIITAFINAVGTALFFTKKYKKFVCYIFAFAFFLNSLNNMFVNSNVFLTIILSLCIVCLYFDKYLSLFYAIALFIVGITSELILHKSDITTSLTSLAFLLFITILLFLLTKWGSDLVKFSSEKEANSNKLLDEIKNNVLIVKSSTSSLDNDISGCNEHLKSAKETGDAMVSTVQEATNGLLTQTESVTKISDMISSANANFLEIKEYSKQLANVSIEASKVVSESHEKINQMDEQMNIIYTSSAESYSTVEELKRDVDDINNYLSSIDAIAEQTNLLALNAAIEAARAGESGKGFTVVAEEVRNLAEQSSNTVKQINEVISKIQIETKNVLEKSYNGNIATKEGQTIVTEVTGSFEKMQLSFKDIDQYITNEVNMLEDATKILNEIHTEAENIASVSEEHSASMEELLATTEDQTAIIEHISTLMHDINNSSTELHNTISE